MEAENKVEQIPEKQGASGRAQSTIDFPYLDLENAVEVASSVHEAGGTGCEWDRLAAHMKQAASGGGFRLRMISAKQFGLVTYDRGKVNLTTLGLRIVDPLQQKSAKSEAFLNVALYRAVFDKFRGGALPPNPGLEREMASLGVAPKQTDKARQVFQRSAKYAGFFEYGADRLVRPSDGGMQSTADQSKQPADPGKEQSRNMGGGNGNGGGDDLHPFIIGLLNKLPAPDSVWPAKDRAKWLQTASNIFDLMYVGADDGEVVVSFAAKAD